MNNQVDRRQFIAGAGMGALGVTTGGLSAEPPGRDVVKIIGVSCSPRKGMTTSKAVETALESARGVDSRIQTELVDLGGLKILPWSQKPSEDDMRDILPKFRDPFLGGLIIGTPCYFRGMSGLAKCFLERLAPLREPEMVLAGKPFGVVSVGAFRNGGQEMAIQQIHAVLLCFGMIPVGGHAPAFQGATLLSADDSIAGDELGLKTAVQLGKRVAEVALKMAVRG